MKHTSELNGARLAWEESGSGVPVVFVHGVICDRRTWRAQEAAVASRHKFVALDLRHHAESDRVGAYRLAQHVEDLKGLLLELRAPMTVLVGHSFGASVVVSLLLQSPKVVAGALLVEPALDAALSKDPSAHDVLTERNERFKVAIGALTQHGDDAAMRSLAEWTDNGHVGRWELVEPEYLAMLQDNAHTFRLLLGTAGEKAAIGRDQLRSIEAPMLVVNGARPRDTLRKWGGPLRRAFRTRATRWCQAPRMPYLQTTLRSSTRRSSTSSIESLEQRPLRADGRR